MILIISVAFQIFFVQVPAVAEFFYIKPLNHWEQLMSVLIGMSCVPFGFLLRLLPLRWFGNIKIDETPMTDQ